MVSYGGFGFFLVWFGLMFLGGVIFWLVGVFWFGLFVVCFFLRFSTKALSAFFSCNSRLLFLLLQWTTLFVNLLVRAPFESDQAESDKWAIIRINPNHCQPLWSLRSRWNTRSFIFCWVSVLFMQQVSFYPKLYINL